jgi:hypothetical protein
MNTFKYTALVAMTLLTSACATLTDAQLETREYRRIDFEAQFVQYRSQCLSAGKRIIIDARQKIGRDGVPRPGDRYYCA